MHIPLATSPANIPIAAIGYVSTVITLATALTPLIFVSAIAYEQAVAIGGGNPRYDKVIWFTIAVALFFMSYSSLFVIIPNTCSRIATRVFPEKDWMNLMKEFENYGLNENQSAGKELWGLVKNVTNPDILGKAIVLNLMELVAKALERVFLIIRFAFLGILYILGPLVAIFSIHPTMRNLFKGWLMSIIQVSFWTITLRALQALFVTSTKAVDWHAAFTNPQLGPPFGEIILLAVAIILMCIATPYITGKVLSGGNVGTAASIVWGGAVLAFRNTIGKTAVIKEINQGLGKMGAGFNQRTTQFFSPKQKQR